MNGAATPGAGSSSGGGGCGIIPHMNSQPPLGSTELGVTVGNVGNAAGAGSSGGQAGDRGSCSADSGVRGSSDRESGGATSVGGNLSDSTTDGKTLLYLCFALRILFRIKRFSNLTRFQGFIIKKKNRVFLIYRLKGEKSDHLSLTIIIQ